MKVLARDLMMIVRTILKGSAALALILFKITAPKLKKFVAAAGKTLFYFLASRKWELVHYCIIINSHLC